MLTNFCTESIFVKVLRRYDTDYSKQHIGLFEGHINTKKTKQRGRAILMNDILRIARLKIALQRAFISRAGNSEGKGACYFRIRLVIQIVSFSSKKAMTYCNFQT